MKHNDYAEKYSDDTLMSNGVRVQKLGDMPTSYLRYIYEYNNIPVGLREYIRERIKAEHIESELKNQ